MLDRACTGHTERGPAGGHTQGGKHDEKSYVPYPRTRGTKSSHVKLVFATVCGHKVSLLRVFFFVTGGGGGERGYVLPVIIDRPLTNHPRDHIVSLWSGWITE